MLALFETPAGYAVFELRKPKVLNDVASISDYFQSPEKAQKLLSLKAFKKFDDTEEAIAAATCLREGSLDKNLSSFLKDLYAETSGKLAVMDVKLGSLIKEKLGVDVEYGDSVLELMRGIRSQLENLISGLSQNTANAMRLGLSHGFAQYTVAFSPEKLDSMIVHAISLLDELDKEINTYAMRTRDWFGVHFPEMSRIITDNLQFAKVVKRMGFRSNCAKCDFSDFLDLDLETRLKEAAQVSMGSEISDEDITNIVLSCDQIIALMDYRATLFQYLHSRMNALAPNLSVMVGELVGARLLAHSGSLMNLAKQPASTVQILGAEKALFSALKKGNATPKYGLIYHASLVGRAAPKYKGKIARVLAAKTSLGIRHDALFQHDGDNSLGQQLYAKVEARLNALESQALSGFSGNGRGGRDGPAKYQKPASATKSYSDKADVLLSTKRSKDFEPAEAEMTVEPELKKEKKDKKDKKDKKEKKDKKDKME